LINTGLIPVPIQTQSQVNSMRVIRNYGADGFSGDNRVITVDEQARWWQSVQGRCHAWLFGLQRDDPWADTVGFGMILRRENKCWSPSAGVLPAYRGNGYGKQIVSWLALEAGNMGIQLHAQALRSNTAAVKAHNPLYWECYMANQEYVYFRTR